MDDALYMLLVRFRRRLITARLARLLALAVLCIAAVCLASAMLQRITGSQLLARCTFVTVVVATVAVVLQLRHLPTLAAAALEIDRQANLRELLSSAVLADHPDGMGVCVITAARHRAAEVDLEQLSAGSPGTPIWIAALLIAGLLPLAYRAPASASPKTPEELADIAVPAQRRAPASATPFGGEQRPLMQDGQTPGSSAITVAAAPDSAQPSAANRRPTRSDTAGTSAGGGLAQGASTTPPPAPPTIAATTVDPSGKNAATGSGTAGRNLPGMISGTGQVAAVPAQAVHELGPTAPAQGQRTVDAQSFPESYRDVLKAYFAR